MHTWTSYGVAIHMMMSDKDEGDSIERDTYGVESVESDVSVRQSREYYPAGTRTTGQQDNTHIIDAIKRELAQGRTRAVIEDERIQRTRKKVDSMWQSLE